MQTARTAAEGGKAQRVYLLLRDEISRGDMPPGAVLPGEMRLAVQHGVSRVTIRRALEVLAHEGLIERRAGSGTVVTTPGQRAEAIAADFTTLMPQLVQMGQQTTARLLAYAYTPAPAMVAEALHLPDGVRVQRAVRVRLMNGAPFSHLTTHVPEHIAQNFSETDLASTPLFRLLERSGVQVDHASQSISASLATPDVAEALDVSVGAALIALTRVVFDASGRGVEHLAALYRPDRFRLDMVLNRVGKQGARQWAPVIVPMTGGAE
ncbi:MAG: GntR family transcriptional regulator [Rhodobacteraceae bacterium]|nr:GntR family transcriptional regulator [Paracoccaceae bacterium]MCF8514088.1 GntR family transcriptional regulator [Paracoccaceae bacterium]MCF8518332.1 GntR family transcriptional regulator [Paracoccaceae bacterium]